MTKMIQKTKFLGKIEINISENPKNEREFLDIIPEDNEYLGFYNFTNRKIVLTPISKEFNTHADIINEEFDCLVRFSVIIQNNRIKTICFDTYCAGIEYEDMLSDEPKAFDRIYKAMDKLSIIFDKSTPIVIINRNKTIKTNLK